MVRLYPKNLKQRLVPVPVECLTLEGAPSDEWLHDAEKEVDADLEALQHTDEEAEGKEEDGGWDKEGEGEEEVEDEGGSSSEGDSSALPPPVSRVAPAKESSLVLAALKAVAEFPEATLAECVAFFGSPKRKKHECAACMANPTEAVWGDRTWRKLPCSDSNVAHVVCSSCCVELAKSKNINCPHCRATYLPPIFPGCRVRIYCPAPLVSTQPLNPAP